MTGCKSFFNSGLANRREFLQVGFAGGLGLTLPELLKTEAKGQAKFYESKEGVAKSLIHIYLPGGMAHQETWDPKPYAPSEYRGLTSQSIQTSMAFSSARTSRTSPRLRIR